MTKKEKKKTFVSFLRKNGSVTTFFFLLREQYSCDSGEDFLSL